MLQNVKWNQEKWEFFGCNNMYVSRVIIFQDPPLRKWGPNCNSCCLNHEVLRLRLKSKPIRPLHLVNGVLFRCQDWDCPRLVWSTTLQMHHTWLCMQCIYIYIFTYTYNDNIYTHLYTVHQKLIHCFVSCCILLQGEQWTWALQLISDLEEKRLQGREHGFPPRGWYHQMWHEYTKDSKYH